MDSLRFLSAGESHGQALTVILEGLPAGLIIDKEFVNTEMCRRQSGYGRGKRMQIESDTVQILAGVRGGETTGAPLSLLVKNRDFVNWQEELAPDKKSKRPLTVPRPGHADFAGALKYNRLDIRDILERASARETACRVAVGAFCKLLLCHLGVSISSRIEQIGTAKDELAQRREVDKARAEQDTLGGIISVQATGMPVGIGSHIQWDKKLDGEIAQAMLSIPAIKGVEFGLGFAYAKTRGSKAQDAFGFVNSSWQRESNNAGGIEGGMSNGEPINLRLVMKPIPTIPRPLPSVDIRTGKASIAFVERSDTEAVEAASVVAEGMLAFILARAILRQFSADNLEDLAKAWQVYRERVKLP